MVTPLRVSLEHYERVKETEDMALTHSKEVYYNIIYDIHNNKMHRNKL